MKKLIQKISVSSLMLFALAIGRAQAASASGAPSMDLTDNICKLIGEMGGLFKTLRTLAFVGAAFIIAGWAWGYISKPADLKLEDVKTKGLGMLVGFILLFMIGTIITIFMPGNGICQAQFAAWNL